MDNEITKREERDCRGFRSVFCARALQERNMETDHIALSPQLATRRKKSELF